MLKVRDLNIKLNDKILVENINLEVVRVLFVEVYWD